MGVDYPSRWRGNRSQGNQSKERIVYAQDTKLKNYWVKVIVEYEYEVEAENKEQAEEEGWKYEDYAFNGSVYSIKVEELESDEDE
jgi:hypothetical protein